MRIFVALYIKKSENVFITSPSVYALLRCNVKRGFIFIFCYVSNVDQTRNDSCQFRSVLISKSNIQSNCKLILTGPLKDTRKTNYQEEFVQCGFISVVINGEERPQCVMYCEVLVNESFKANRITRHLKKTRSFG